MDFEHPAVVSAIFVLAGTIITGVFTLGAVILQRVGQVNKAVNNRAPGEPLLYEMVKELLEWKQNLSRTPMKSGDTAERWVGDREQFENTTNVRLDDLEREEKIDQQRIFDLENERDSKKGTE